MNTNKKITTIYLSEETKKIIDDQGINLSKEIDEYVQSHYGSLLYWEYKEKEALEEARKARESINEINKEKCAKKLIITETENDWLTKAKAKIQQNPELLIQKLESYNWQFRKSLGTNEFK